MASAAPSRQQPRAAGERISKRELLGRRWSPARRDSQAANVYQAYLPDPWAHARSVHLGSPPVGPVPTLAFSPVPTLAFSMQKQSLDRLGDLLQTPGERWNLNSDPGFSDVKAHVPHHCIAWLLVTRFLQLWGLVKTEGSCSVWFQNRLLRLPASTSKMRNHPGVRGL